jgi:hypothetical protein
MIWPEMVGHGWVSRRWRSEGEEEEKKKKKPGACIGVLFSF